MQVKNHVSTCLVVILFFVSSNFCLAQEVQDDVYKWYTELDGLPSRNIEAIIQDLDGNIFIGGYFGCIIFDGKKMQKKSIKDGLPSTAISNFYLSPKGRVWAYTYSNEFAYYENGKFHSIGMINSILRKMENLDNLVFDENENLYLDFVFPSQTIILKKTKKGWIHQLKVHPKNYLAVFRNPTNLKEIMAHSTEKMFGEKLQMDLFFHNNNSLDTALILDPQIITNAKFFANNKLYYGLHNHLFVLSKEKGLEETITFELPVKRIFKGSKNTYWATLGKEGIQQLNSRLHPKGNKSFPENNVNTFLSDHEGGNWFATGNGLAYLYPSSYKKYKFDQELNGRVNESFFKGDTIFIGHNDGSIGYFIPNKMSKERFIYNGVEKADFANRTVLFMHNDKPNKLFYTIRKTGAYELDLKSLKVTKLLDGFIRERHVGRKRTYYPSFDQGILMEEQGQIKKLPYSMSEDFPSLSDHIYEQKNGDLLIGDISGVWKYSKGKMKIAKGSYFLAEGVTGFFPLKNDIMAIATNGAGIAFCSTKDTIILNSSNGLIGDVINDLYVDKENRIWVSALGGISIITFDYKLNRVKGIRNISAAMFLNWDIFNIGEIGQNMYIVSNRGLTVIPKDQLDRIKAMGKLIFESISLNGNAINTAEISFTNYKNSRLEFIFKSISFLPDQKINYYYRIKNYQEQWLQSNGNHIDLNNLPPGDYVFELFAMDAFSKTRTPIISKSIKVNPQFWQHPLFAFILLLLSLGIMILIYQVMIQRNRKKMDMREQLLRLKQEALNAKLNPHFIFNALNSIQNFIVKNDSISSTSYLAKFAKLVRLVLDCSAKEMVLLEEELQLLRLYLDLEQLRFQGKLQFEINIEKSINTSKTEVPLFLLQPYVENAIWHGINHRSENGLVQVDIRLEGKMLHLKISDNGLGRDFTSNIKKSQTTQHKSHGLSINERRIEVINTLYSKNIRIEVNDRLDVQNNCCGTEVSIWMNY